MSNLLEEIAISAQKMKKDRFPDHVCAQANRIMCHAGSVCDHADGLKYRSDAVKDVHVFYLKKSLIQTAAACIVMISELEKDK